MPHNPLAVSHSAEYLLSNSCQNCLKRCPLPPRLHPNSVALTPPAVSRAHRLLPNKRALSFCPGGLAPFGQRCADITRGVCDALSSSMMGLITSDCSHCSFPIMKNGPNHLGLGAGGARPGNHGIRLQRAGVCSFLLAPVCLCSCSLSACLPASSPVPALPSCARLLSCLLRAVSPAMCALGPGGTAPLQ